MPAKEEDPFALFGRKPKILILFCGGTIVMKADARTGALDISGTTETIKRLEPRLKKSYELDAVYIDNIDSTDVTTGHWGRLVEEIAKNYGKYDGFVVTHGTNTLGYTSSALSFALQGIGKPVVLTGSQIPSFRLYSDARTNFVNAVRLAAMDISGVYVVFGSKIILGCRAKKDSEFELEAFKSFNSIDFGEIGVSIKFNQKPPKRHGRKFTPKPGFEADIMVITLEPGISKRHLDSLLDSKVQGFIIRGYGSGDIPDRFLPFLEEANKRKVPIVITTQCPNGVTQLGMNMAGLRALNTGIIQAFDMSMEAMTTKLRWLLHRKTPYDKIRVVMESNLCGESASFRGK